jgi:hypothetical protein
MPKKKELAFKRIPLKPETVRRLKHYNADHDSTYDESINMMLDMIEKRKGKKD